MLAQRLYVAESFALPVFFTGLVSLTTSFVLFENANLAYDWTIRARGGMKNDQFPCRTSPADVHHATWLGYAQQQA